MINQVNHPITNCQEESGQTVNTKIGGLLIGAFLTILATFVWSGLVLVGIAFLGVAFGLILTSIINFRLHSESNWGSVLLGQFIAMCGTAILLISYFL